MPRVVKALLLCLTILGFFFASKTSSAQTEAASVSGRVVDASEAVVPEAKVEITNTDTNITASTSTNKEGLYLLPGLKPGRYRLTVSKPGFKTVTKVDLILHVQDSVSQNFALPLGSVTESVTVTADSLNINTTDGSVGTVVDRKYVENVPLNGRSFQDLILLTPGVVTSNPQLNVGVGEGINGEFSVNGQRTESNYYTVDGVSANLGTSTSFSAPGATGSLPASTALGTTQGLVSVDALEEFRVQSSTYSAEYGRNPGGQFSFATRSGTNQWHGTAFDYLRNNVFDANDWFNNYQGKPEPPERQNDFGGTLGGPVRIPRLYNGKDKTFFFSSYEGLRLAQPQPAIPAFVPDTYLRTCTPAPLQQVLNAFPKPPAPGPTPDCTKPDPGSGLVQFIGTWSNPGDIDSTGVRLDQVINDRLRFFFRFSNTSSSVAPRSAFSPSIQNSIAFTTRTYTFGSTASLSTRMSNEFRLNYSSNDEDASAAPTSFGGAMPVDLNRLQGFASTGNPAPAVGVILISGTSTASLNPGRVVGQQKSWNVVNTLALSLGRQRLKFGFDFRRLNPSIYQQSPAAEYLFFSANSVQANSVDLGVGVSNAPAFPVYINFSAFAEDEWKLTSRLNLSMGLRWEVNPAPGAPKGNLPFTARGNTIASLTLAPPGTPLWNTSWFNFAPRLGAAYALRNAPGRETVVRAGGGVFFDTGQHLGTFGYQGIGFSAMTFFGNFIPGSPPTSFPAPVTQVSPKIQNPPMAPFTSSTVFVYPAHLQLPYTLQWNASIEQALGKSQTVNVTYVGANGRRLLANSEVGPALVIPINPNFGDLLFIRSGLTSRYDALQVQFQRRLAQGLQALGSYTWSHGIDFGSRNASAPYIRGNSDFDIRHNFSAAFSYDLPNRFQSGFARAVLNHWGLDDRFSARTGFPVTLNGPDFVDPGTGALLHGGLDLIPGQPLYIYGSQCAALYNNGKGCPGGRAINPNAFSLPATGTAGNAPRNFLRGFGAWQMDFAVRREFPIHETLKLQFRAEAFNIFNHPNFGAIAGSGFDPTGYCNPTAVAMCTFGQANQTLANSLGGLNSLYQMGGARSMQFALKLLF